MAATDYDPYDMSNPYRTNSYGTGMYGNTGATTPASQQNAYSQSYGSGNSSGSGSRSTDPYATFSDAASSWGPRNSGNGNYGSYGGYDTQSPYDSSQWQQPQMSPTGRQTQFPVTPIESPYTPPIVGRQPGHGAPPPPQYPSPTRPGVTGTIGQPPQDAPTSSSGPSRPGVSGSIGTPTGMQPQSAFTTASGQPDALAYYKQWLPSLTLDQLGQYWSGAGKGQRLDDWWNSTFNADGSQKSATGNAVDQYEHNQLPPPQSQQWGPGEYKFVPGYGWTASAEEYAAAQRQAAQPQSQAQGGPQQTAQVNNTNNGGASAGGGVGGAGSTASTVDTSTGGGVDPTSVPGSGAYTHSNITPPAPVPFPTAPGGTSNVNITPPVQVPGGPSTSAPGAPASGLNGISPASAPSDLASQLRSYLAPEFQQEQSDLNRQMLATGAASGDLNSGGFAATAGKQQARLSADQGSRLSNYLTQASEAEKNRKLQTYQIDTNAAIAKMNDETAQFGIRTNDDLQRYLNSQNNSLAKYGIDKNDVLQRYIAIQQAHGQSSAALSAFNAAALQAATQQSIAAMNNQTAKENSQNQYNLGVLGINADNYRNDSNNLLAYLNLIANSNPQPPVPQIPGVVGYGG